MRRVININVTTFISLSNHAWISEHTDFLHSAVKVTVWPLTLRRVWLLPRLLGSGFHGTNPQFWFLENFEIFHKIQSSRKLWWVKQGEEKLVWGAWNTEPGPVVEPQETRTGTRTGVGTRDGTSTGTGTGIWIGTRKQKQNPGPEWKVALTQSCRSQVGGVSESHLVWSHLAVTEPETDPGSEPLCSCVHGLCSQQVPPCSLIFWRKRFDTRCWYLQPH